MEARIRSLKLCCQEAGKVIMLDPVKALLTVTLVLSIVSLFVEQVGGLSPALLTVVSVIDYVVVTLIIVEFVAEFRKAAY